MLYKFDLVCPGCNGHTQVIRDSRRKPQLNCSDCLMDRVEVVELKVVKVEEVPDALYT